MAFVGGEVPCDTMASVQPGDRMILKRGIGEIVARNGTFRGNAAEAERRGDDSKSWLRDFEGWDLQAWCYVDWRLPPAGAVKTDGLVRATAASTPSVPNRRAAKARRSRSAMFCPDLCVDYLP